MADSGKGRSSALKLRVEVNGEACTLDLEIRDAETAYTLRGVSDFHGVTSIENVAPGVFSVLLNHRSIVVHMLPRTDGTEVWVGSNRYLISLADPRDKASGSARALAKGPAELRAQMPGKIIKLLTAAGDRVKAGQGLIVVEAMKMQNEVKSPRDGTVAKIHVVEGVTVAAGDLLLVVA